MMNRWELPKTLNVGGADLPIRYQFGPALDILTAYSDPELDDEERIEILLRILYPEYEKIPQANIPEAVQKACEFIDCGQKDRGRPSPRLLDWSHDAPIIIPAVNSVAGMEVRAHPDMHWWTFWGYFMSIGNSLFSSVLHIRRKKASRKKLEKWEEEFYTENKSLIDMPSPESEEIKAEKESILKWL